MKNLKTQNYYFGKLITNIANDNRDDNDLALAENCRKDSDGNVVVRDAVRKLTADYAEVNFLHIHQGTDGNDYLMIGYKEGTTHKLGIAALTGLSTAGLLTLTNVTQAGGSAWTNSSFKAVTWEFDTIGASSSVTWTILTNGTDAVAYWKHGLTATVNLILTGTAYKAVYLAVIGRKLVLANVVNPTGPVNLPNWAACSNINDPTDFAVASGKTGDLFGYNFPITGIASLPQPTLDPSGLSTLGIVTGVRNCEVLIDSGSTDASTVPPFTSTNLSSEYGSVGKNILEVEGYVYMFSGKNIYRTNGGQPEDISIPISDKVNKINPAAYAEVIIVREPEHKCILFGVPYGVSAISNKTLTWSTERNEWISVDDFYMQAACSGVDNGDKVCVYTAKQFSSGYVGAGIGNQTNLVDWHNTALDVSGSNSAYKGTINTVTDTTHIVVDDFSGNPQDYTTTNVDYNTVWFPSTRTAVMIASSTAAVLTLAAAVPGLTAGDEYYIGYIPFYIKTNHKTGESVFIKKLYDTLLFRYAAESSFSLELHFIKDWQSGIGANVEMVVDDLKAGLTFPLTFPFAFQSDDAGLERQKKISIRNVLNMSCTSFQLGFRNYKNDERPKLIGYSLGWFNKGSVR